jgi:hypothetical protein
MAMSLYPTFILGRSIGSTAQATQPANVLNWFRQRDAVPNALLHAMANALR